MTQKLEKLGLIIVLFFSLFPGSTNAYDLWQEKEMTDSILPFINKSKHLWLETDNNRRSFSLYEPNISHPLKGGVIILPNINLHVDWPSLIRPLRTELTQNGWQVLTLQPPTSSHNQDSVFFIDLPKEITQRINAAIDYYTSINTENIVLLAHGHSANIAALYLSTHNTSSQQISAFVGISFRHQALSSHWPDINKNLELIQIPLLDIHGRLSNSLAAAAANQRANSAHLAGINKQQTKQTLTSKVAELAFNKTGNLGYRQITLSNSDYDLQTPTSEAVKKIRTWLSIHSN